MECRCGATAFTLILQHTCTGVDLQRAERTSLMFASRRTTTSRPSSSWLSVFAGVMMYAFKIYFTKWHHKQVQAAKQRPEQAAAVLNFTIDLINCSARVHGVHVQFLRTEKKKV
jgi:hypothetical protein